MREFIPKQIFKSAKEIRTEQNIISFEETLAEAHWLYLESVLKVHFVLNEEIKIAEHHYKTAFIHGFKHGVESCGK
jgi:hypothetical protein